MHMEDIDIDKAIDKTHLRSTVELLKQDLKIIINMMSVDIIIQYIVITYMLIKWTY